MPKRQKIRLEDFAESDLGKRYSVIKQMWLSQWDQVVPLFNFPPEVRKLIYTTNSIEALNRSIRKVIKPEQCSRRMTQFTNSSTWQ